MANHNVQLSFSCSYDVAKQLDEHLAETNRYRGRSEFIREAVQEKIEREHRSYILESDAASDLRNIYWVATKTDPSDDDLVDWVRRGLKFPPGIEIPSQPISATDVDIPKPSW